MQETLIRAMIMMYLLQPLTLPMVWMAKPNLPLPCNFQRHLPLLLIPQEPLLLHLDPCQCLLTLTLLTPLRRTRAMGTGMTSLKKASRTSAKPLTSLPTPAPSRWRTTSWSRYVLTSMKTQKYENQEKVRHMQRERTAASWKGKKKRRKITNCNERKPSWNFSLMKDSRHANRIICVYIKSL